MAQPRVLGHGANGYRIVVALVIATVPLAGRARLPVFPLRSAVVLCQDRDCAAGLIDGALRKYPRLKKIFSDGGYAGPKLARLPVELEIVKRTDKDGGFNVLRRRWVVERTFS